MAQKSISQLQKEIKEIEEKKRDQIKRKELEEKLKRLKHPSKRKIGVRERIRMGFGERISRSLDQTTGISRPVKRSKPSKSSKKGDGMLDWF